MTKTIPKAPGALPLLGHVPALLRDPLGFLDSLPDHDVVRLLMGRKPALLVREPELTRRVLVNDRTFDKTEWYGRVREVLGDGSLIVCPHSGHRRMRRLVQPVFHPSHLPGYAEMMTSETAAGTGAWSEGQKFDVLNEMTLLVTRALVRTMFSDAPSAGMLRQTTEDILTLAKLSGPLMVLPSALAPLFGGRRYRQAGTRLREVAGGILSNRRAEGADPGDLLSALLAARPPAGPETEDQSFTSREIIDQLTTFYGAGTDTTATTLAWALHLLAQHQEVEDRVHAEVDAVLAGTPAGVEHLPRLPLTARVIKEALRLYPAAWMVPRTATADTRLGNHHVPAGMTVIYSPYVIQRLSDLYEQPDRFDPDRWDHDRRPQPPRHAFLPFGGGARKCIAEDFAVTHATIALATITARWRLTPAPGCRVRPSVAITLAPNGLRMQVSPRSVRGPIESSGLPAPRVTVDPSPSPKIR
ncbi:cytochrome P450 [Streptomyces sp. NPDC006978]|uniref:cytochrome P450 n=1 Tax=Streptomyces sp. NPDC006978 TaxID=3364769 RepID=UPI0036765601